MEQSVLNGHRDVSVMEREINKKYYYSKEPFQLECGKSLPGITIAYHTYGELSANRDNIIWVCHALTTNSDIADWWPDMLQKGRVLDPENSFVICTNILGSPYGSTSPISVDTDTQEPYYGGFPLITVRDMVHAHRLLAEHLGITQVRMLIGSCIGGFQVLEWLVEKPDFAQTAVLIATVAKADPKAIAFNESQRMAIRCDPTFGERRSDAGAQGLAVAYSFAMLNCQGTQVSDDLENTESNLDDFRAANYQRYQGVKLAAKFDAYCYYYLTQALDSHDVGRKRGGLSDALSQIMARCTIICLNSHRLFPSREHTLLYGRIKKAKLYVVDSNYGHNGALIESDKLNKIIKKHLSYDN